MAVTNTLAYHDTVKITDENIFRVQSKARKELKTENASF
jgi:hypothetical protein